MQQIMQSNKHEYGFAVGGGHSNNKPVKANRANSAFGVSEHSMWKNTQVRVDATGREEAFSIGPDGYIWSYFRNADAFGAGRLKSTGLMATTFVLGQTDTGRAVIVAADGIDVRHVMEDDRDGRRWTKPRPVACHGLSDAVSVETVLIQSIGSTLFVALLLQQTGRWRPGMLSALGCRLGG